MAPQKDVPVAQRLHSRSQNIPPKRSWRSTFVVISAFLSLFFLFGAGLIAVLIKNSSPPPVVIVPNSNVDKVNLPEIKKLLGHFAYEEAPSGSLEVVATATDGYKIKLRHSAATKFQQMVAAAKADGVELQAISGFRSKKEQDQLFFAISRQRNQTPVERAKVSAPAGYSEHHTGYAVDIGDRNSPQTILTSGFDQTAGFRWLTLNASKYSFQISFPQNNPQGVAYEPWHWRFVGDDDSLATFYQKSK